MGRVFHIIVFVFFFQILPSQIPDSIAVKLSSAKSDTERLDFYQTAIDQLVTKNPDAAVLLTDQAIQSAVKSKNDEIIGNLYRLKAGAYYFKGKYEQAGKFYFQSLELLSKNPQGKNLPNLHNDLGKFYRKLKQYNRALQHYSKALTLYQQRNDQEGIATVYNESGVVYEYMQQYDEAINRYKKSYDIQIKRNDLIGQGYALEFIGGAYLAQKKYFDAEKYLLESLSIRKKTNDNFAKALNYNVLGNLYLEQKDYHKANDFFSKSLSLAKEIQYLDLLATNYHSLSKMHREKGDYKEAFDKLEMYKKLNDSIFNLGKTKQIEELSVKYETVEKDKVILENRNKLFKRNIYIFSLLGILMAGFLITYSIFNHRRKNEKIKLQKTIIEQQDLATKAVMAAEDNERSRMATHLHDGVAQLLGAAHMNLEMLNEFKNNEQLFDQITDKTKIMVSDAISEVRSLSHQIMPNKLIKSSLADALRELIMKTSNPKLQIRLNLKNWDDQIAQNLQIVLYRVIQECINNTIKHAQANEIDITLNKKFDTIFAEFKDNGVGFNPLKVKSKSEGLGLQNIKSRLEMLKGTFQVVSQPGIGTTINISVPVH